MVCRVSERPVAPAIAGDDLKALSIPEVAQRLGVPVSRVQQLVRDGHLLAIRRDGALAVPEEFLGDETVVKGLAGTVTVLRDGGYDDEEIARWLLEDDPSLPGTPIEALRGNRGREIKRRAQAMAL
jgi:excisionase family DNA binding protein